MLFSFQIWIFIELALFLCTLINVNSLFSAKKINSEKVIHIENVVN